MPCVPCMMYVVESCLKCALHDVCSGELFEYRNAGACLLVLSLLIINAKRLVFVVVGFESIPSENDSVLFRGRNLEQQLFKQFYLHNYLG